MQMQLIVSVGVKKSSRDLLMNQFRQYTETSYKVSTEKAMVSNNNILERVFERLKETLFTETVNKKTFEGRVGPDAQYKRTEYEEKSQTWMRRMGLGVALGRQRRSRCSIHQYGKRIPEPLKTIGRRLWVGLQISFRGRKVLPRNT